MPEVALQDGPEKDEILLPQRPIQAEVARDLLDFRLGRPRVDQQVKGIPDRVHPGEDQHRDDEEHHHALHQPPDQEDRHDTEFPKRVVETIGLDDLCGVGPAGGRHGRLPRQTY